MSVRISITCGCVLLAGLVAGPAFGAQLPKRQPGLWETRAVLDGRYRIVRRCFKPGEQSVFVKTVGMDACSKSVQQAEPGYLMQVDCRFRGLLLLGRVQIAGDFDRELRGRVRTTVIEEDGSAPTKRAITTFTSRRLGDCPTG